MAEIKLNIILTNGKRVTVEANHTHKWRDVKENLKQTLNEHPKNIVIVGPSYYTNDEDLVKDSNVNEKTSLHCFIDKALDSTAEKLNFQELHQLKQSLSSVIKQTNFEDFIMKLRSLDKLSQLAAEYPCVLNDPECLAILQESSLLTSLADDKEFDSIIEKKPLLGRLLQILCTLIKSEGTPSKRSNVGSYALEELSDDDMDIDQDESGENSVTNRSQGASSFQPITPAQLAAALQSATGSSPVGPRSGLTTPSSTSTPYNTPGIASSSAVGTSPGGGNTFTSDMFNQALQNALAASARRGGSASTSENTGSNEQRDATRPDEYSESLELMREMGIQDDALSIEALQVTNGDVQAAVNLIFAQWMADD